MKNKTLKITTVEMEGVLNDLVKWTNCEQICFNEQPNHIYHLARYIKLKNSQKKYEFFEQKTLV